jgi:hypothetical protein
MNNEHDKSNDYEIKKKKAAAKKLIEEKEKAIEEGLKVKMKEL